MFQCLFLYILQNSTQRGVLDLCLGERELHAYIGCFCLDLQIPHNQYRNKCFAFNTNSAKINKYNLTVNTRTNRLARNILPSSTWQATYDAIARSLVCTVARVTDDLRV